MEPVNTKGRSNVDVLGSLVDEAIAIAQAALAASPVPVVNEMLAKYVAGDTQSWTAVTDALAEVSRQYRLRVMAWVVKEVHDV